MYRYVAANVVEPITPYRTPNCLTGESTKSIGESSCNNVALSGKNNQERATLKLVAARGSLFQRMIFSASEMEGF